jgi:hypothetical protein
MSAMAVILSGVGFELSVCGDEGTSLCIEPLITVLDKSHLRFPLDDVFIDVTNLLPLEWAALLAVGRVHKRVFGRARTLHDDDGEANGQVELEFLVHDPDVEFLTTWRCQIRFEIPSAWTSNTLPATAPRRRLIVHVRVDEAQSSAPQHFRMQIWRTAIAKTRRTKKHEAGTVTTAPSQIFRPANDLHVMNTVVVIRFVYILASSTGTRGSHSRVPTTPLTKPNHSQHELRDQAIVYL